MMSLKPTSLMHKINKSDISGGKSKTNAQRFKGTMRKYNRHNARNRSKYS